MENIKRALSEYWKNVVTKDQIEHQDIHDLLDVYVQEFKVDAVYVLVIDPTDDGFVYHVVSTADPKYDIEGKHCELDKEQYHQYLKYYSNEGLCDVSLIKAYNEGLKSTLHYAAVRDDTFFDGCVGMRTFTENRDWTQEERQAVRILGRALSSYISTLRLKEIDKVRDQEKLRLAHALEAADFANKAKSRFILNMSHDIRTPMNAIFGYADRLTKADLDDEKKLEYAENIHISGDYLLSLINNVLEMARIESDSATLDEELIDVEEFVNNIHVVFAEEYKKHKISISRSIRVRHNKVFCDVTKCREIFLNVISNSLKYTPAGGRIEIEATEAEAETPGYTLFKIKISDTGVGMSQEFLPHLFESFTREKSFTENKVMGTGLGMSLVHKYVELMGGTVEAQSEIGIGTSIQFEIPFRLPDNKSDNSFDISKVNLEAFRGKRILLAEDNYLNAEIAMDILKDFGLIVDWAEDGVECVNKMQTCMPGTYELILMDIQMPKMDGYKATENIRHMLNPSKARIPIFAMTANTLPEDKLHAVESGMTGFIAKPVEIPVLIRALASVIH